MVGQTISHYKILAKIGEGGMGVVYKAKDLKLRRTVALKFLRPKALESEEHKARFIHEAQAAAALNHPNICTIHEIDEVDGHSFIAMEFVEGQSVREKVEARPLPLEEALDIAIQTGQGLEAAHRKSIFHRDIKSANVMVTAEGQVKIMDFGLAHLGEGTKITKTGTTLGTPAYMSPEQVRGGAVDHRADIWSLGVVLYEMMSGQLPFKGEVEAAVSYGILHQTPEPLTALRAGVPLQLDRVLGKTLAKAADERYQHVADLLVDLRAIRRAPSTGQAAEPTPSIAVLPFTNMSADPENEYFSDGLAEEIINALTKVPGLKVTARTSAFAFRGKDQDVRVVGAKLNVARVLEGSVRKVGNRIRVAAQLIDVADGYHLWSDRYDREMKDVFDVQDELARAIVRKLDVKLVGEEDRRLVKRATENLEAHSLYLKGLYHIQKLTPDGMQKGTEHFERAKLEDLDYALPYAGLASVYELLGIMGQVRPREAMARAKAEALKALELDESLAPAHQSLAVVRHWYEWDWPGAEREFQRAIELNPGNAITYYYYSRLLGTSGRLEDALAQAQRAVSLDPISPFANLALSWAFGDLRRYDDMIDQNRRILELVPDYLPAHWHLGAAYEAKGMHQEAIEVLERGKNIAEGDVACEALLGWVHARAGRKEKALESVARLKERALGQPVPAIYIAFVYTGLGDNDSVFRWLETAYEEREPLLCDLKVSLIWEPLHSDPRFSELLKKMGFES